MVRVFICHAAVLNSSPNPPKAVGATPFNRYWLGSLPVHCLARVGGVAQWLGCLFAMRSSGVSPKAILNRPRKTKAVTLSAGIDCSGIPRIAV